MCQNWKREATAIHQYWIACLHLFDGSLLTADMADNTVSKYLLLSNGYTIQPAKKSACV